MTNGLQWVFNFYFREGWLWLGLIPVLLLVFIGKSETALNSVILGKEAVPLYDGDRIRLGTVELTFFMQAGR